MHLRSPGQHSRSRGLPVRRPAASVSVSARGRHPAVEAAPFAVFLTMVLLALAAGAARAAVGIGTSPATIIDTMQPTVILDALPANLLLHTGQSVAFHWTTADDHPGTTAADFTAQTRDGATPLAEIDYLATIDDTTWNYQAPDIWSGQVTVVVTCRDAFGNTAVVQSPEFAIVQSASGVPAAGLAGVPVLEGNQPNPCNPGTTVRFSLPDDGHAVLDLYAADGARVRRLAAASFTAGPHEVFWDGRDDHGRAVASGTYLLRLTAGNTQQSRKLALVR